MSTTINIDNGHCETAASTVVVENGKNVIKHLNLSGNHEQVIPSAIYLTNEQMQMLGNNKLTPDLMRRLGEVRIGVEALTNAEEGEYFIYFKVSPDGFDKPCGKSDAARQAGLTHGKVIAAYVYQVVMAALKHNTGIPGMAVANLAQVDLMIGCPATGKWTDLNNIMRYAQLIRTVLPVKNVTIVPESRAAIYNTIGAEGVTVNVAKGVCVFDFGSSTADCTYMLLGRRLVEFSWDLGASAIEQQMMLLALKEARMKNPTATPGAGMTRLLSTMRTFKEKFYRTNMEDDAACAFVDSEGKRVRVLLAVDEETMEKAVGECSIDVTANSNELRQGSWKQLCREFMQQADKYLKDNDLPCSTVALTGGATHMPFIREICEEVFGKGVRIINDENPSYSVAHGLGWVSVVESSYQTCVENAKEMMCFDESCNESSLVDPIVAIVASHVKKTVLEQTQIWAGMEGADYSVADLEKWITKELEDEKTQRQIKDECEQQIEKWLKGYKNALRRVTARQAKQIFAQIADKDVMIDEKVLQGIKGDSFIDVIDAGKIIDLIDISKFTNKIMLRVVQAVIVWICAGFGPLGWVASAVAVFLAEVFGSDEDKDKPRPQKFRTKIAKAMPDVLNGDEFSQAMGESMKDVVEKLTAKYVEVLEQTVERAIAVVALKDFDD